MTSLPTAGGVLFRIFLDLFLILQANHSHRSLEKIPRSFQRLSLHTDDCLPDLKPWAIEPSDLVLSY